MSYMNEREFAAQVAQDLGWTLISKGLVKNIIGSDERMGCTAEDLIRLLKEHDDYGNRRPEDILEECLLRIEGSFVLMTLGYQIYKEDK